MTSGEWIDVIPLIDPKQDKWDNTLTGANSWRVEGGELIAGFADAKPCKLLLPLDGAWQSFEYEVEFTRGPGGRIQRQHPDIQGRLPGGPGRKTDFIWAERGAESF